MALEDIGIEAIQPEPPKPQTYVIWEGFVKFAGPDGQGGQARIARVVKRNTGTSRLIITEVKMEDALGQPSWRACDGPPELHILRSAVVGMEK